MSALDASFPMLSALQLAWVNRNAILVLLMYCDDFIVGLLALDYFLCLPLNLYCIHSSLQFLQDAFMLQGFNSAHKNRVKLLYEMLL